MNRPVRAMHAQTLLWALVVLALLVGSSGTSASGAVTLESRYQMTTVDPNGDGVSTVTLYYHLPQQAQVGSNFTVPVYLYVDNLTDLMSFLFDYSVQVTMSLSNGKVISGTAGVNSTVAAEDFGALQLHPGQSWGPANITMPLTQGNTGLSPGQEAVGNTTIAVNLDVWFNQPVDYFRPEGNQTNVGYVVLANGTPAGPQPNYLGFVLLGAGIVIVAAIVVTRPRRPGERKEPPPPQRAPGSV